jgi:hypothetical protein
VPERIPAAILDEYIAVGSLFSSTTFRVVATKAWEELGRDPATFKCSQAFIHGFKERNGFSSRRFRIRRRDPVGSQWDLSVWIAEVQDLIAGHVDSLELIVNCDETAWRVIPNGLLTGYLSVRTAWP